MPPIFAAYNLGAAYLKKQMVPEALAAFRQAAAINPDYAAAHRALGELCCIRAKSMSRSPNCAARPSSSLATRHHAALAKALSAKGLTAEADEEMRKAQHAKRDGPELMRPAQKRLSRPFADASSAPRHPAPRLLAASKHSLSFSPFVQRQAPNIRRPAPNVILITIDTVRADHLAATATRTSRPRHSMPWPVTASSSSAPSRRCR